MKKGEYDLHEAIGRRDRNTVLALLLRGVCANAKHYNGDAPLHLAAKLDDAPILKLLLAYGAEIDAFNKERITPLFVAARHGHVAVVETLLAAGADPTRSRQDYQFNVLDEACAKGHTGVVEAIVEKLGSRGDVSLLASRALLLACRQNRPDVIDLLIHAGADIEHQTPARRNLGQSALHVAARHGYLEATHALLRHGADTNRKDGYGCTPLQHAANLLDSSGSRSGCVAVLKLLVERGADVNTDCGAASRTALHSAACANDIGVIDILVGAGACVDVGDVLGLTPLHEASRLGNSEAIAALLRHGAEKDKADAEGLTPLHVAVRFRAISAVNILLAAGADVGLRYGELTLSALDVAAQNGPMMILKALIQHGALDVPPDPNGFTPLHYAAGNDKADHLNILVEAGGNVNARTDNDCTPLHCASTPGSSRSVLALLTHGADVNAQSKEGESPLHLVARCAGIAGGAVLVDLLLRWGADETCIDDEDHNVSDVVGLETEDNDGRLEQDVGRVRKLLRLAPADRAWRRRCLLIRWRSSVCATSNTGEECCRKVQSSSGDCGGAGNSCTGTGGCVERCPLTAGGGTLQGEADKDKFERLPAMLFSLKEEGVFRSIVLFL